jgi:hypothetical protein
MDPTLVAQLGAAGVTVAVLIGGMKWLSGQYIETRNELKMAAQACADREAKLVERLQKLEDDRNYDLINVVSGAVSALREAGSALQTNAATFHQWSEESGKHRTVVPILPRKETRA